MPENLGNPEAISAARYGAIQVTIPAAVAFNLGAFHKGIANLVEHIGCQTCFSGVDCTFVLERNFLIDPQLGVRPLLQEDPSPQPSDKSQHVTVSLPSKVAHDIGSVKKVVAEIAARLAHPECCSGFDISFQHQYEFLVNENLGVIPR